MKTNCSRWGDDLLHGRLTRVGNEYWVRADHLRGPMHAQRQQ
jgi:hypothetical protein